MNFQRLLPAPIQNVIRNANAFTGGKLKKHVVWYSIFVFFLLGFSGGINEGTSSLFSLNLRQPIASAPRIKTPLPEIANFATGHSILGLLHLPTNYLHTRPSNAVNSIPVFLTFLFSGGINGLVAGFLFRFIAPLRRSGLARVVNARSLIFFMAPLLVLAGAAVAFGDDGNFSEFSSLAPSAVIANLPILLGGSLGSGIGTPIGFVFGVGGGGVGTGSGGQYPGEEVEEDQGRCRACGKPLDGRAFCTGCGNQVGTTFVAPPPPRQPPAQPPFQTPEPQGASCSRCGASIPQGRAFCTSCGNQVAPAMVPPAPVVETPPPIQTPEPTPVVVGSSCRDCGATVPEGRSFCTNCGARQEEPVPMAHCRNCGSTIAPGRTFCTQCGAPTKTPEPTPIATPTPTPSLTPTPTPSLTPTPTPTPSLTPTPTPTPSLTPTPAPTLTLTPTPTPTPSFTPTPTATPTSTSTPVKTPEPTRTPESTQTVGDDSKTPEKTPEPTEQPTSVQLHVNGEHSLPIDKIAIYGDEEHEVILQPYVTGSGTNFDSAAANTAISWSTSGPQASWLSLEEVSPTTKPGKLVKVTAKSEPNAENGTAQIEFTISIDGATSSETIDVSIVADDLNLEIRFSYDE